MADKTEKDHAEPHVRVVDRRWWAQQEGGGAADGGEARKPSYVEDLERQLAEQGAQLQSFAGEHRRALEEFEQAKTRIRREVARDVERGRRAVLVELLEVLDNLDRAIAAARAAAESTDTIERLTHGVEMVRDQFLAKLSTFGVSRLDTLGQKFEASRHEAVTTTPVGDPDQDGVVVSVVKEGYAIGDEILRPAAVVVGRRENP